MKNLTITDFEPMWDNVVVEAYKLEKKEEWVRPVQEEDKSELGKIIAIGKMVEELGLKVGDVVLFNKYSSTPVDIGDALIVRAEDIVAVAKKK